MKILYMSDLHLEINGHNALTKKFAPADVLIVAGDLVAVDYCKHRMNDPIARSIKKAVDKFKTKIKDYKKVFLVAGNHEYYHSVFSETIPALRELFADCLNVEVLDKQTSVFEDVLFFGATFWTNFGHHNPVAMEAAQFRMNDYRLIYKTSKLMRDPIHPDLTFNEHLETMRILKTTLEHHKDEIVVVIGHHAPCALSLNKNHSGNELDDAYYSDLSNFIMERPQIKLWFHGHCHMSTDYMIGETRILSNQSGYYMEPQFKEFRPNKIIEING